MVSSAVRVIRLNPAPATRSLMKRDSFEVSVSKLFSRLFIMMKKTIKDIAAAV